jgi:perosamine synthetase
MTLLKYAYARTAFKVGLQLLKCQAGQNILLPDFLCNVVWHPLDSLGLKVITYSLNDDLRPNWDEIEDIVSREKIFALLMVHYFGQPQDIDIYVKYCINKNILLVEDNAHGLGGYYNGKPLGSYGDVGFSSPRKFIDITYGSCLYLNNVDLVDLPFVERAENSIYKVIIHKLKSIVSNYPNVFAFLKSLRLRNVDWSNPHYFQEKVKIDRLLDDAEKDIIKNVEWCQVATKRRKLWKDWKVFCDSRGLKSVFSELHPESSPWALPVYANDLNSRNKWLRWGVKQNVFLFTWPALPISEIEKQSSALKRWEKMICFPLDGISPDNLTDEAKNTEF